MAAQERPRRAYSRHGLNALKARVKVRGLGAIDRRSSAARALLAWRDELITDLGGATEISAQQRAVVELAARTKLYLDSLDAYLMEQRSVVDKRRRAVLPVVRERQTLADALARLMGQLGLERRAKRVPSLSDYLASQTAGDPTSAPSVPEKPLQLQRPQRRPALPATEK